MKIGNSLCFDDVLLVPQYSDIESRKEVSLTQDLGLDGGFINLPIVSSPMDTITEVDMAVAMHKSRGFGIVHRYNTILEQVDIVKKIIDQEDMNDHAFNFGCAIGVTGDYLERASRLYDWGCRVFCIDVAHGHHISVKEAIKSLRNLKFEKSKIIAGNVATREAFDDLADWGADMIRVGIGGGSICSTRIQTGHGMPTLQSIIECSKSDREAVLIADGGIRNSGDIVKALAAGADLVMVGSLLAGTNETPGEVIVHDGKKQKVYRGMASRDAQIDWRGHSSSLEGVSSLVSARGPLKPILEDLEQGIRSGLSYSGCRTIKELQSKAKFIKQSSAGSVESSTHISRIGEVR